MSIDRGPECEPGNNPDADPEMLKAKQSEPQPDQAEGADDASETGLDVMPSSVLPRHQLCDEPIDEAVNAGLFRGPDDELGQPGRHVCVEVAM